MNYCQSFCRTIQRLCNGGGGGGLPPEYQQVEYLQSKYNNGGESAGRNNQYIVTGINYFADCEIDGQMTNTSYGGKICGVTSNNCIQRYSASNPVFSCWNSGSSYYATAANTYTRHKIKWANNSVYVDGVLSASFTKQQASGSFNIFGAGGDQVSQFSWAYVRVYGCKLWDTNGALIRDYIPCYRISDNKTGMYDLVTDTFYTNAGTGEFAVGNNV